MAKIRTVILFLSLLAAGLQAQSGGGSSGFRLQAEYNGYVTTVLPQPDGKILVSGFYTRVNGVRRSGLARLNPDGSLDSSFDPGTGSNDGRVETITLQPDGKILVMGSFTSFNGVARGRIARLNTDGSLDTSFSPVGSPGPQSIYCALVLPDNSLLVGGSIQQFNGVTRTNLVHLLSDGTLDLTYSGRAASQNVIGQPGVRSLTPQTDGKIIITGAFTNVDGVTMKGIARLNSDGSLDASFNTGSGPVFTSTSQGILSARILPDGKIITGGDFTSFNGAALTRLAKLNSDGSLDSTFNPGTGFNGILESDSLTILSDGRLLVGGQFSIAEGLNRSGIVRLNADGSVDNTFDSAPGTGGPLFSVALQTNSVLIGGSFLTYDGQQRFGLARLGFDGALDPSFNTLILQNGDVKALAVQPDGRVVAGGNFLFLNGNWATNLARLNSDGSLDPGFSPAASPNNIVRALALQADGRIVVGGSFVAVGAASRGKIARLNPDGSVDSTFDSANGFNADVNALALQSDGKIFAAGGFATYAGVTRTRVARLNGDGSLDPSFDAGPGANGTVFACAVQPDGKLLLAGGFSAVGGSNRFGLARLKTDGTVDNALTISTGGTAVNALALQSDGNILIGGTFTVFSGTSRNRIARLKTDGSMDAAFNPGSGFNNTVNAISLDRDGRIYVGGLFTSFSGSTRSLVARLNSDGSLDARFDPPALAGQVESIALGLNRDVLAGGTFTMPDTTEFEGLAILAGLARPQMSITRSASPAGWQLTVSGESNRLYRVQSSTNLVDWLDVTNLVPNPTAASFIDTPSLNRLRAYRTIAQ